MVREKIPVNSEILKWARVSKRLEIKDVARKLKQYPTLIKEWEEGVSAPSYAQLERLAYDIYKRPLIVFFFDKVPEEKDLKTDFRTLPESIIDSFSSDLIKYIREARDKQFVLRELFPKGNPSEKLLLTQFKAEKSNPEETAHDLRSFLKISLEVQKSFKSPEEAYRYYREVLAECGVFIFQYPFDRNEARGFCLYDESFPVILVSSKEDEVSSRIFTIFHEVAHLIFGTSGITTWNDQAGFRNKQGEAIEVFCNKFSADVLVPKSFLIEHPLVKSKKGKSWKLEELRKISKELNVSIEVIFRRLLDLGRADKKEYEEYRTHPYPKKRTTGGPTYAVKTVAQLGSSFIRVVLNNLYGGKITPYQATSYLKVKSNNMSKIEAIVFG
ncbi:MAG: ImmA/IrrE family metallo-endopeptidase [Candidatus Omnitrophica bacterium]|nr:ImmA/IrrE family metallo-endopeptidase [Candidatus Omnitrophota bacterium]